MTLDEAIKHAEKVAEREYKNAQVYNKTKNNNLYHPDKITCEQAAERCRECAEEHRQLVEWLKELRRLKEQEPCGDCISRQAAIVALDNRMSSLEKVDMQIAMGFAKGIIHELPPVTPAEKVGRWKRVSMDKYVQHAMAYYRCSECGGDIIGEHNYCPNCGTKMQEVEE